MLGYEIELKSKVQISRLCYETEDGTLGQDGIGFNFDALYSNKFMVVDNKVKLVGATNYEDGLYAYLIENEDGKQTYVHLDWIAKFKGSPTIAHSELSADMLMVTRVYFINPKTGSIEHKNTLPSCSHCGSMGTVLMGDGKYLCTECNNKLTNNKNYSWKPDTFKMVGSQLPKDRENPVWYGLEIEMATDREALGKFMYTYGKDLYLKDDGSIEGDGFHTELVSHPHSFKELMLKDSWLSNMGKLSAEETDANGCHVHISRTAFVDDRHYSMFYFLMHKMDGIATKVGGRQLTHYCELIPSGKVFTKKNDTNNGGGRQLFLNESNDATIEARFFKGTTNVINLKAYVQYLESIIKYTRYHTDTVNVKGWFEYVTEKSTKYKELLVIVGNISAEEMGIEVIYREPISTIKTLTELTATELSNIVYIKTKDGKEYKDVVIVNFYPRQQKMSIHYNNEESSRSIRFSNIETLTIEEE